MQPFAHLHVHSQYSLLDGQAAIRRLVDKAIDDGMKGMALTDHGVMYGIKEFINYVTKKNAPLNTEIKKIEKKIEEACKQNDPGKENKLRNQLAEIKNKLFKPIIGCECYVARRNRFSQNDKIDSSGWHLVVLAKNFTGYKHLIKMVSKSWTEGFYYRPRIDKELLEHYHEGLIVLSACLGGEIPQKIDEDQIEEAEETVRWYKNLFGDDFYLELQRHKTDRPDADQTTYPKQEKVNKHLLRLAKKYNVKVVATNDVHFVNEEDAEAHDRLICLSTGKDFDDPTRMRYTKQEWLKTTAEMNLLFSDVPSALTNTLEILDKVEFYSIDHEPLMPFFPIDPAFGTEEIYKTRYTREALIEEFGKKAFNRLGGYDKVIRIKLEADYLTHLTKIGARKRYGNKCPVMLASSIQAELDNPYGVSKKAGEELLFRYAEETGARVYVYRFPNVFGKWCRPNYNSAVATFCYNIAHDLPIQVNDPNVMMTLVYIDDVVDELISALAGNPTQEGKYCKVPIEYKITLGEIVELIYSFRESRRNLQVPDMGDAFTKKLYATYLSYLPENNFSYPLKMNVDQRGSFTEFLKSPDRGQMSVNISKPGITKGNHWHHTKNEKFLVVHGKGVIRFRKIDEKEIHEYYVSGDKLEVVDIPVGYTHNIENLGDTDMVTIMWANEAFDLDKPDTYFLPV
jgi:dTDP-4-dehydrorhamnose 3,5-epimerase-like enzyme/histidinol phosphatase-like PHP family hydrolase